MFSHKRFLSLLLALVLLIGFAAPLHVHAAGANVLSCTIDPANTGKVNIQLQADAGIGTDDSKLYLFAVPTYVDSVADQTPVASTAYQGAGSYSFSVPLNNGTAASLLYSKFCVGVRAGGVYTAITGGNFITNPEVIASSQLPRTQTASKKGIHLYPSIASDIEELNVKHGYFNLVLSELISNTPTDYAYTYNGKTYYFTPLLADYDYLVSNMTKNGMAVTLTLLNEYSDAHPYLYHPGVGYREGTSFYAVNTSTQQGLDVFAATAHFLAERYNGTNPAQGKVDNWIMGNEVNDNYLYYYMGQQTAETFVQEYLQSFRVMYNAVKSAYANANVYICLEQQWNTADTAGDYGGKKFIDLFNAYTTAQGNIDWGLSYHPYSFPINDVDILNDGEATIDIYGNATFGGEITGDVTTPLITMKNLPVLTNYFHNTNLLNPNGQVRSIILGEQGYTTNSNITGQNEAKQAANIALSYYMAEMNPDVDAFLLRGHSDENEGSEFYKFGLRKMNPNGIPGEKKYAYDMYAGIDTPDSLKYTEFAKNALNITDWVSVVPGWNSGKFSSMADFIDAPLYNVSGSSGSVIVPGMTNQWEPGYNMFEIGPFDYDAIHYPNGVAVVNSFAVYPSWQGIEKHFSSPVKLSSYLTLDANFKPMDASYASDKLEVKVRLHSGDDTFTATGIVDVSKDYKLCLNLQQWPGRNSVDTMEVLIRESGKQRTFGGTFTIYNVTSASSVSGSQQLPGTGIKLTDLSGATLSFQKSFDYSGNPIQPEVTVSLSGVPLTRHQDYDVIYHNNTLAGTGKIVVVGIGNYTGSVADTFNIEGDYPTVYNGVDYAPVYSYGYYRDNNPMAVAEVGDDPQALLEHFVTKGMQYALQGTGSFNVQAYAQINSDLQPFFWENWPEYYMYHLTHGIAEGRSISGLQPDNVQKPVYPCTSHVVVQDLATTPDCLKSGLTAGSHCSLCGTVLVKQEVLAALGHDYGLAADGKPDFWDTTCDVCGAERKVDKFRPTHSMYRMYNPNSGEHFYTGDKGERQVLEAAGWKYEGVGFTFPASTGKPVYRLFQPSTGEHLYTMSEEEKAKLLAEGWNYEGIAFNSGNENEVPQYRLWNPNVSVGAYHFTASQAERAVLLAAGWQDQGIGFYTCWQ